MYNEISEIFDFQKVQRTTGKVLEIPLNCVFLWQLNCILTTKRFLQNQKDKDHRFMLEFELKEMRNVFEYEIQIGRGISISLLVCYARGECSSNMMCDISGCEFLHVISSEVSSILLCWLEATILRSQSYCMHYKFNTQSVSYRFS